MALIVNGERIENSEIQKEVERLRPDYERVFADRSPEEREAQLLEWSKENAVERVLIRQEAKTNGVEIPKAQIEALLAGLKKEYKDPKELYEEFNAEDDEKIKQTIELIIKLDRMIEDIYNDVPKPSKNALLKYYQENKEQFKSDERVRVAHIVKYINWQTNEATAENQIREAQNELEKGAVFESLVEKYSDCPEDGGDLGYIIRGQMVEEFDDVVFNLAVGRVSDVFRTRYGFHIAKIYNRKPAVAPPFEDVRDKVVDALKKQVQAEAFDEFIDGLKSKAEIEVV